VGGDVPMTCQLSRLFQRHASHSWRVAPAHVRDPATSTLRTGTATSAASCDAGCRCLTTAGLTISFLLPLNSPATRRGTRTGATCGYDAAFSSSSSTMADDSMSDDSDNTRREKALGDLWASAYDGWIDVPGAGADVEPGTAIFARPVAARHAAADDAVAAATQSPPSPLASSPLLFPPIVTSSRLFALTGFNPMGEDRPVKENRAANKRLAAELASAAQTSSPAPKAWWRAFGFSREWREDGFVVAYTPEDAARGEADIVAMAVRYGQGAIFAYEPIPGRQDALLRRTVPAAMGQQVEADVTMERCVQPALEFAEPFPFPEHAAKSAQYVAQPEAAP